MSLFDLNVLQRLLLFLDLFRNDHGEHTVSNLGTYLVAVDVVGQNVGLLVIAVRELATQIVDMLLITVLVVFLLFLVLKLILDSQFEVALIVDAYAYPLFLKTRHSHFHRIVFGCLLNVYSRSCGVHAGHQSRIKEIVVKPIVQPILIIVSTS